jgi:MFS family permease
MLWPSWDAQWLAFACIGLVFLWPAWSWRPPVPETIKASSLEASTSPTIPARWLWTMLASYFAAGWGFVISATFTVAIVEREPLLAGQGHLAWAMVGFAAMPAVFVWDRVARLMGDKQALLIAFGLQTLSVLMPAASGSMLAAIAGAIGYGATFIGIVSLTLAIVGRLSPNNPGKTMARFTLGYGAAQMIAPVVAGYMAQFSGSFHGALWVTAAVMATGMAVLATLPQIEKTA